MPQKWRRLAESSTLLLLYHVIFRYRIVHMLFRQHSNYSDPASRLPCSFWYCTNTYERSMPHPAMTPLLGYRET